MSIRTLLLLLLLCGGMVAEERLDAQTLFSRACTAFAAGNYAATAQLLTEFNTRYADEPEMSNAMPRVLYVLGCAEFNLGRMNAALDAFERHLACAPRSPWRADTMLRIAMAHQALGAFDEALQRYERIMAEAPGQFRQDDVRFQLATCLVACDRLTNAVPVLRDLMRARDTVIAGAAAASLLHCLMESARFKDALALVKDIVRRDAAPDHAVFVSVTALTLGDCFSDEYAYDRALEAYRCVTRRTDLLRRQKERVADLTRRRSAYVASATLDATKLAARDRLDAVIAQAGKQLQEFEAKKEFDLAWLTRLGLCFYEQGRMWEACVAFREAVQAFPGQPEAAPAHVRLVFCLNQMQLYDHARREIDRFVAAYPAHEQTPLIQYVAAETYINQERYADAERTLKDLLAAYPDHPHRARAEFYLHLSQALQEKFDAARHGFTRWLDTRDYKTNVLRTEVQYWHCMALLFGGDASNALRHLADFVAKYPQDMLKPDADYRIAVAQYTLARYRDAALTLARWVAANTNHTLVWEARVLRGDALAALGELPAAIKAYRAVTPASGPHYHYAAAQAGKCYKLLEDYTNMVAVYEEYVAAAPDSPGVVEGVYWLGWAQRQMGNPAAAREVYWDCLRRHGNRRVWQGFDDIVRDLGALYAGSNGLANLACLLEEESATARARGMATLASRIDMALCRALERSGRTNDMAAIAAACAIRYPDDILGADGLMFLARRDLAAGRGDHAAARFRLVADTASNAPCRAEAELRLAQHARTRGRLDEAASLLARAEAHAADAVLLGETMVERGDLLLAARKPREAVAAFEAVLANRAARGPLWPRALIGLGTACEDMRDARKAIPYYQRVYVMYAGHAAMAAKAYYRSGRCFEQLAMPTEAAGSYHELLANDQLASSDEAKLARTRLAMLKQDVAADVTRVPPTR